MVNFMALDNCFLTLVENNMYIWTIILDFEFL